jgi:hypothetical protein
LGHDDEREREPGYLLAAGANPLTANLLNFITLSLAWKREGMRGLFPGAVACFGAPRRREVRFLRALRGWMEFIARKRRFQSADAKIA